MNIEQFLTQEFFSKYATIILTILLIILMLYILYTFAIIALSKHAGEKKYRYLAWIPPFNIYYTCKLGFGNPLALILFILSIISSNISITINDKLYTTTNILPNNIKNIIYIILLLFVFLSIVRIYRRYSKNYIIYIILSILSLGILSPIFLFVIRNKQRVHLNEPIEDVNLNANTYIEIDKAKQEPKETKTKDQPHIEEEYDIRNSWEGPK